MTGRWRKADFTHYIPGATFPPCCSYPGASAPVNLRVFISNLGQQTVGRTKHREARAIFKLPLVAYWTVHNLIRSPVGLPCFTHSYLS